MHLVLLGQPTLPHALGAAGWIVLTVAAGEVILVGLLAIWAIRRHANRGQIPSWPQRAERYAQDHEYEDDAA